MIQQHWRHHAHEAFIVACQQVIADDYGDSVVKRVISSIQRLADCKQLFFVIGWFPITQYVSLRSDIYFDEMYSTQWNQTSSEGVMELSEFRSRYNDAQNRFSNSLQAITTAIEIVAASKPQRLHTINLTLQTINDYVPQIHNDYQELTAIVDEFCNSQQPWNNPP